MYTERMSHEELERFYYITNDPRHAALVTAEDNLTHEEIDNLEDQVSTLEREAEEARAEANGYEKERDAMQDERDDAVKEISLAAYLTTC